MTTAEKSPLVRYIRGLAATLAAAELSDAQLLERFAGQGDEIVFEALVRRHGPLVLGVCQRVLRNWHDAEDAFQATFVALARQAGSLRRPESLGPWLHGVALRTALKARGRAARRRVCEREAAATRSTTVEQPDVLVWRDLRPVLDEAVASLPESCRIPFVLCYLEGRTVSEAARELGWPRGTVATRLALARQRLRVRLASRGVALSAGALAGALSGNMASARPPVSLLVSTARAALVAADHGMATGAGPATAAALAQGGNAMLMTRVKVAALLLALGVAGGGVGLYWQRTGEKDSAHAAASESAQPHELAAIHADRIVATVNGEAILAEDVYAAAYLSLPDAHDLAALDRSQRITAVWRKTLDRVIEREVILQEALTALKARNAKLVEKLQEVAANEFGQRWVKTATRSAGLKDDEELRYSLRAQGTSLDAVRRQWERDFMAEEYLRSRVPQGRGPGSAPAPSDEVVRQERARIVAQLKRQAVIEYAGSR
jgi:RNA polymerase sigma factor (sigma-70 family)